jgi:signal transduction histidine kinase/CheY-like chemotaxis protein/HPt (histidine-containing phosphotransfer) domain-containing protein
VERNSEKKIHDIFLLLINKIWSFVFRTQIGVIFITFAIMVFFTYRYVSNIQRKHLFRDIQDLLTTAQVTILADLHEPETVLIGLTQTLRHMLMSNTDKDEIRIYIETTIDEIISDEKFIANYGGIYGFFDSLDGIYLDSMKRELPQGYIAEERPWYKEAIKANGRITVTSPYIGYSSDYFVITYTRQILDDDGNQLAILCLDVEMDAINELITGLNMGNNGYGILFDTQYTIISHPNKNFLNKNIFDCNEHLLPLKADMDKKNEITEKEIIDYKNRVSIFFMRPLQNGWYMGINTPKKEYYKPTRELASFLILSGAIFAIILSAVIKQMFYARQRAEEQIQTMFESAPLSCIMYDKNLNVLSYNNEALKLFELSNKNEFTEKFFQLSPENQPSGQSSRELAIRQINKTFEQGYNRFDWIHQNTKGIPIPCEIILVRVEYRHTYAIACYVRDLREIKAVEYEKHKAEIAEESNKTKSDFLARVSHEIRTPLNAILGIAEIQLQDNMLTENVKDAFGRISNSGGLLLAIINDILDLSKIEAGKMELMQAKYEVASLIHDTAQLNLIRYESKPLNFNLYIGDKIPAVLVGDELRIKQILNNLLSNAFKYTDNGEVTLSVSAEYPDGEESDQVILIFLVSDTGQGMTADQLSKLGNSYSRFNMEANRATVGTGLGMTITKTLIKLMDGDIKIESEVDKGSVFTVFLPQWNTGSGETISRELADNLMKFKFTKLSHLKQSEIKREFMPYGRVLIVDDVETNLYVAKGLMMAYGLSIDTAQSGFEAIEKIKNNCKYDIIFMDHMMPKMDGMETTKKIREIGYKEPVVALTANALTGQAEIFMRSGFDDYISKPIDNRDLNATLNRLIRDKQPPEVIKNAREQEKKLQNSKETKEYAVNANLAEVFIRDAKKALDVMEKIYNDGLRKTDDINMYVINVHSMKSALANIKEQRLSDTARKLEDEGREKNIDYLLSETPAFFISLREVIEKLSPGQDDTGTDIINEYSKDEKSLLLEKFSVIKEAAEALDRNTAKTIITELQQKKWKTDTKELLDTLAEYLLHSEFDDIVKKINEYLNS